MIRVITPPAAYPCTLAEAKQWCRIDPTDSSQDAVLTMLIGTMTAHAEHMTGRAFVERTLEWNMDPDYTWVSYPIMPWTASPHIELPFPPLLEIQSVMYTDVQGNVQEFDATKYEIDNITAPGRLRPVYGSFWPAIGRGFNPFRVRYQAGYRPPGSPVDLTDNSYLPAELRSWMAARICALYDIRSPVIIERATVDQMPRALADGLLDPLIVGSRLF